MTICAISNERRAESRRRVLLSGKLTYDGAFSSDCPIRDQSETGARVIVGAIPLPRRVVLVCVTQGVAYEADVVWRRRGEAGLRLGRAHCMTPAVKAPTLSLARRIWADSTVR